MKLAATLLLSFLLSSSAHAIDIFPADISSPENATQAELDAGLSLKVSKAGDTMIGQLTISGSSLTVGGAALVSGVLSIETSIVGTVMSIRNTLNSGWSAADIYDDAGSKKAGFGYGNSGSSNSDLASRGYFWTNSGVPLMLHVSSNSFYIDIDGNFSWRYGDAQASTMTAGGSLELAFGIEGTTAAFSGLGSFGSLGVNTTSLSNAQLEVKSDGSTTHSVRVSSASGNLQWGITSHGHMEFSGPDPVVNTCANGSTTTESTDGLLRVDFTGANSSCSVDFADTWDNDPFCFCNGDDASGSINGCIVVGHTTTQVTFKPMQGGAWASGDHVEVFCAAPKAE